MKEWVQNQYEVEELKDIVEHGCISGCASGMIYYFETEEFYNKFKDEIWHMIYDLADDQGITSIELIASLNGSKDVGSDHQFKNLLAWLAVEECARQLIDTEE